jgi:hypothetical protein
MWGGWERCDDYRRHALTAKLISHDITKRRSPATHSARGLTVLGTVYGRRWTSCATCVVRRTWASASMGRVTRSRSRSAATRGGQWEYLPPDASNKYPRPCTSNTRICTHNNVLISIQTSDSLSSHSHSLSSLSLVEGSRRNLHQMCNRDLT